jgi:hypothetical protein
MNYPEAAGVAKVYVAPIRGVLVTVLTSGAMSIWSFP